MAAAELSRSLKPRHLAMAFTPSLAEDLHVSLIALIVVILAYLVRRGRRRSVAAPTPSG